MNAFQSLADAWAALAWAVTWQMAALGILAWLAERAFRLRQARVRHALWWFVLLAPLVLAPGRMALERREAVVSVTMPAPVAAVMERAPVIAPPPAPAAVVATPLAAEQPAVAYRPSLRLVDALALAWLLGCGLLALRLVLGHRQVRRMLCESSAIADSQALSTLRELCGQAGVRGKAQLRASDLVSAPVLYGLIRPTVLVPEGWMEGLTAGELRSLLAHEVAHIRRRDTWANLVQRLLEIALFFHPAAWLANRRITLAREELCDAWALSLGTDPTAYAKSLASAAERAHARLAPVSLGVAESRFTLLRRVDAIMSAHKVRRLRWPVAVALAGVLLVLVVALAAAQVVPPADTASVSSAQDVKPAAPQVSASKAASPKPPTPPALTRLWQRLDALQRERDDLAWQRWQALGVVEQARMILRYQNQALPPPHVLANLTEEQAREVVQPYNQNRDFSPPHAVANVTPEQARGVVDRYEREGADARSRLQGFADRLVTRDESAAFGRRRRTIVGEIASLGQNAASSLIAELLDERGRHTRDAREALAQMGRKATPALLDALKTATGWRRSIALGALAAANDPRARDVFLKALDDRDPSVRGAALAALAAAKDPRTRDVFLKALDDRDSSVRRAALGGLEGIGTVSQAIYLRFLEEADPGLRGAAISGLGKHGDARAIPALLEVARYDVTEDKGGFLGRQNARMALEQIAARTGTHVDLPPEGPSSTREGRARPSRFDELAAAARCNNAGIRQSAIQRLGNLFHEPRTLDLLKDIARRDRSPQVRAAAITATGHLLDVGPNNNRALVLSRQERNGLSNFLLARAKKEHEPVRLAAFNATRFLWWDNADLAALPELFAIAVQWAEGEDTERQDSALGFISGLGYRAPRVLERLATPKVRARLVPRLVAGMDDPNVSRGIRFIAALGSLRERSVVPRLIELLGSKDAAIRRFAAGALGNIGDKRALPALEKLAATDPDRWADGRYGVREAAQRAIEQIRGSAQPRQVVVTPPRPTQQTAAERDERPPDEAFPIGPGYRQLEQGHYREAVETAQQVLSQHQDDAHLIWRSSQVIMSGLIMSGQDERALGFMDEALKKYGQDQRPAPNRPLGLTMQRTVASCRTMLYRRRGDYASAASAHQEYVNALQRLMGDERAENAARGIFAAELGDIYLCAGEWALAGKQYESALEFSRSYRSPVPASQRPSPTNEQYLMMRLPGLVEVCEQAASSPAAAEYARQVDRNVMIGDYHDGPARWWSSDADRRKAHDAYQTALDFLTTHGVPTTMGKLAEKRYRDLLAELPKKLQQ